MLTNARTGWHRLSRPLGRRRVCRAPSQPRRATVATATPRDRNAAETHDRHDARQRPQRRVAAAPLSRPQRRRRATATPRDRRTADARPPCCRDRDA
jgi:hypothetical protein